MPGGPLSGLFRYGESELDPAIHAEILFESARNEARVAVLELILAIGFGAFWYNNFTDEGFLPFAVFVIITVIPLLVDSAMRRGAAKRLLADN